MSSLFFKYGTMNSGKTTDLLQAAYNYRETKKHVMVCKPSVDNRAGTTRIESRVPHLSTDAITFSPDDNIYERVVEEMGKVPRLSAVLIDEAQFLTRKQVRLLCYVVDKLNIPVLCYGLRTDREGNLFPGSQELLAQAEKLEEIKTICVHCESKATHVLRIDQEGNVVRGGEQVVIGGNEMYESVCRHHFLSRYDAIQTMVEKLSDPNDHLPFRIGTEYPGCRLYPLFIKQFDFENSYGQRFRATLPTPHKMVFPVFDDEVSFEFNVRLMQFDLAGEFILYVDKISRQFKAGYFLSKGENLTITHFILAGDTKGWVGN